LQKKLQKVRKPSQDLRSASQPSDARGKEMAVEKIRGDRVIQALKPGAG
jgi:hypothetical protein